MSDHRHVAVKDRTPPSGPGPRRSRRGDDGPPPETLPNVTPPRGRKPSARRIGAGGWASIGLTGVLVIGTLVGYKTLWLDTFGSIDTVDVNKKLGENRPVNATGALNVLLVGSDTREGDNLKYGQKMLNAGKRTDTIILMHISPNRDKATLVSFPRDSMVDMPACQGDNGNQVAARHAMINTAYNDGGITCTIAAIEHLTDIRIDHFVEVDFTGFKNIVDALGGIRVCLKTPVDSKKAKLTLPAGWSNLNGEKALGYVRLRDYGDNSDIQRIKRQQVFLTQVVKKATSSELLTDVGKLTGFISEATKSVKMNPELANDQRALIDIAMSAKALTANGVKFITVPWGADPADKNRVVWRQPAAGELFESIKNDTEVTPTASPTASAKPAVKHEQVRVQVLNGTDKPGLASEVAGKLAAQGFVVTQVGNARPATGNVPATSVRYAKKDTAEGPSYADALAARLSGDKLPPTVGKVKPISADKYSPPTGPITEPPTGPLIQLVIGDDWKGVRVPTKIPDSLKDQVVDTKTNPCQ